MDFGRFCVGMLFGICGFAFLCTLCFAVMLGRSATGADSMTFSLAPWTFGAGIFPQVEVALLKSTNHRGSIIQLDTI